MPAKKSGTATADYEQTSFDLFEEVQQVVRAKVDEAGAQYHTGQLAVEILDELRGDNLDLYNAWLDTIAIDQLKIQIGRYRTQARRRESAFSRYLSVFDRITEEVDASHTQRRIGDMTRSDLEYVSRMYLRKAKTMTARGRRLDALAKRLPDNTTTVRASNITEEEIEEIFLEA
jgi:hypothetical protein